MTHRRSVVALIPARGGSKGIPRKNLVRLGGRPLLVHTIERARQAGAVNRVVVSTDDPKIAAVARAHGAEVIMRPAALASDVASSESVLLHALDQLKTGTRGDPELVVFLQPTSPLRQPDDIDRAVALLRAEKADSLFSACPGHGFLWRMQEGSPESLSYDFRSRPRRQDAPEDLVENGSIYVFKPWVLRKHNNRLGGKIAVYWMRAEDSFQIDTSDDLALVEKLFLLRGQGRPPAGLEAVRLLVLDFDGVMTDNRVLVARDGRESVRCHRGDGWGIARLKETGVGVVVLSGEENPVVAVRCRKLGIPCVTGSANKLRVLKQLARQSSLAPTQIAYVGNDANDLGCLGWVGVPIAVADAEPAVRTAAAWVTTRRGGRGAVREVCDILIRQRGGR